MATSEAQDNAAKQRIVNHMNADHTDSVRMHLVFTSPILEVDSRKKIRRYLEAFSRKSVYQTRNARMTDVTLNDMKFECGGQQITIAFDPPLKSYRETRERVVQLDKDALRILQRSDIAITKYIPPWVRLGHLFNFTQCVVVWVLYSRAAHFKPGSLPYDLVLYRVPRFANFSLTIQPLLMVIMLVIHLFEVGLMIRKLGRHGLTLFDGMLWAWSASAFIEGFTSFWRLNTFIAAKKQEKEAKKH